MPSRSSIIGHAGEAAQVEGDSFAMRVVAVNDPPLIPQRRRFFRQYLTDANGSIDMGIDGSTNAVDFAVTADATSDRYITQLDFIMGYGSAGQPFQFADGAALTNGIRIFYESLTGEVDIHDGVKTNQDMLRFRQVAPDADWEIRGIQALNDYGYFTPIDLENYMPPFGIKLDAGTPERLVVRIRDNVGAAADTFNAIAYGFDRF